jgi:phosphatidylserine/phosphatidylglycerophosphate/cardiolipin synthase-like enzyme
MTDPSTLSLSSLSFYFNSQRGSSRCAPERRLVSFIEDARSTLDVAIYDLTQTAVLDALAAVARDPDRRLRIAFDASGEQPPTTTVDPTPGKTHAALEAAGLIPYATPVYIKSSHLMHDKFMVRDGDAVWTGSANFTEGDLVRRPNVVPFSANLARAAIVFG